MLLVLSLPEGVDDAGQALAIMITVMMIMIIIMVVITIITIKKK